MGSWQLSLRVDRPIEGCEVFATAYLYQRSLKKPRVGAPLEAPIPPPPPSSEYRLHYRWLRGPELPVSGAIVNCYGVTLMII